VFALRQSGEDLTVSPPPIRQAFAGNLRALRERRGLTQERAAQLIGCDYKYYQTLEAGSRDIHLSTLERIANAFGVDASGLVGPLQRKAPFKGAGSGLKRSRKEVPSA
jgi:transcriptional regulator with XRE-family HTH domain